MRRYAPDKPIRHFQRPSRSEGRTKKSAATVTSRLDCLAQSLFREYPLRGLRDNFTLNPIEPVVSEGLARVAVILAIFK
jgi:hypothetical protein